MYFTNASDFAKKYNLPLITIRKFCREGVIPALTIGRTYRFDEEEALHIIKSLGNKPKVEMVKKEPAPVIDYIAQVEEIIRSKRRA